MENNQCVGLFGYIFGHKYKARYDTHDLPHFSPSCGELAKRSDLRELIATAKEDISQDDEIVNVVNSLISDNSQTEVVSTYKGDVCVRCGNVVNKPN